ncbi:glutathione-S-transferase/glutaredoxin [Diplonema papillatum]|nr:glutathione-S-transferase/glutaredoxin [Diplonema papillatum]
MLRRGMSQASQQVAKKGSIVQRRAASSSGLLGSSYLWAGTLAVGGAGAMAYASRLSQNRSLKASDINKLDQLETITKDELLSNGVTLYRYLTCPFCGKVRAFLDHYKIPYKCVEVDPLFKSQMKGLNYSKVPYLKVHKQGSDDTVDIADSYEIVSLLGEKMGAPADTEAVTKWRRWAESDFVRYVTLNLNRSLGDAWSSAAYIDVADEIPAFNKFLSKAVGAPIMYVVVQKLSTRPKLMKAGYDGGDEREALYKQVNNWIADGIGNNKFNGGDSPNAADTDVYGVINAVRGLPVYLDILQNTKAKEWVDRMDVACGREPWKL